MTSKLLLKAIAQFTVRLQTSNSKYDKVMRNKQDVFFTDQEKNGYNLFKANCASCHTEPLLTRNSFADNGLPF